MAGKEYMIPEGAQVIAIKRGRVWASGNLEFLRTKRRAVFRADDLCMTPERGFLDASDQSAVRWASFFARAGYYGFVLRPNAADYGIMLAKKAVVEVLN